MWGKAGRANTATDPAGLDMFETTISLKPEAEWRAGHDAPSGSSRRWTPRCGMPGVTNAWTMPIKGRIDMLATGIRTPVGIKIFGPDLAELERIGKRDRARGADGSRHPDTGAPRGRSRPRGPGPPSRTPCPSAFPLRTPTASFLGGLDGR